MSNTKAMLVLVRKKGLGLTWWLQKEVWSKWYSEVKPLVCNTFIRAVWSILIGVQYGQNCAAQSSVRSTSSSVQYGLECVVHSSVCITSSRVQYNLHCAVLLKVCSTIISTVNSVQYKYMASAHYSLGLPDSLAPSQPGPRFCATFCPSLDLGSSAGSLYLLNGGEYTHPPKGTLTLILFYYKSSLIKVFFYICDNMTLGKCLEFSAVLVSSY